MHVRRDDTVEVMTGEDRGVRARVLSVDPRKCQAIVESVNRVYKHLRRSRRNPQGGRLEIEAPVDLSNLRLVCPKCDKGVRVGVRIDEDGTRHRVCRACGTDLGEV